MTNVIPFKPRSPAFIKHKAAHTRALASPMHALPFVGEPMGITAAGGMSPRSHALRRAALWACWKGQHDGQLPEDLRDWNVSVGAGGSADAAYLVSLIHAMPGSGWLPVTISVPLWAIAEGDGGLVIDHEPPCPDTAPMRLTAPQGIIFVNAADSILGEFAILSG